MEKQPETADLTFPKVRAEHKMGGMVLKFHICTAFTIPTWIVPMFYLEVQVQEQTSWGRSRPSKLLTPENVPQTATAATGCCVRCLGNDGVLLGFGSGEGSLVKSHMSFRFIMKHYQT